MSFRTKIPQPAHRIHCRSALFGCVPTRVCHRYHDKIHSPPSSRRFLAKARSDNYGRDTINTMENMEESHENIQQHQHWRQSTDYQCCGTSFWRQNISQFHATNKNCVDWGSAPFQILLDGFNIIGETVLFMSRDGTEFTIPKNQIRDILSINFPMEARVEHGEISRKHSKPFDSRSLKSGIGKN